MSDQLGLPVPARHVVPLAPAPPLGLLDPAPLSVPAHRAVPLLRVHLAALPCPAALLALLVHVTPLGLAPHERPWHPSRPWVLGYPAAQAPPCLVALLVPLAQVGQPALGHPSPPALRMRPAALEFLALLPVPQEP